MSYGLLATTIEVRGVIVYAVPFVLALFIGIVILVPITLYRKWYFYRRRLKKQTITAEYEPPLGFNPAEIGYMFDGKLGEREVGGTIIWMVQKGFLHIKKVDGKKRIFAGPRVDDNLKTYEKKLVEEAENPEGATSEQLMSRFITYKSDKVRSTFAPRQLVFTHLVHSDLQRRQYVRESNISIFMLGALKVTALLTLLIFFVPFIMVWVYITVDSGTADFDALGTLLIFGFIMSWMFAVPMFVAGSILHYIRGRILGRQWIVTPKLARMWPQIVGFREYVKLVENERLEFYSKDLEMATKSDLLPYAVALGFVKNWRDIIS